MPDTLQYVGAALPDIRFQDGALPHAIGVHSFQVLRANRERPELADDTGWTYNHAAMLAYDHGRFYLEYLSNPVSEHEVPGHTLLVSSENGRNWTKPIIAFPAIEVDTAPYRGPKSPLLTERIKTVPHQRMGFYKAQNGVLLVLAFYGIVHDREMSMPCDGWGIGRAVRRIYENGSLGTIHFLKYNEVAGFTSENTPAFPLYVESKEADFVNACREILQNKPVAQQMYEEQRFDKDFIPTKGEQALSFYTVTPNEMIGVYKKGLSAISRDGGQTWSEITKNPTIVTATGKVWGQRTSDGRFALLYNPTTDGQHRWPIAIVTGDDGHVFCNMLGITGFMSPIRYGGLDKNLGPQYMRGICEVNPQPPDGHIWLAYSNNKEDIWISRIPVPVTGLQTEDVYNDLNDVAPDGLPRRWNIYSPKWAPVTMEEGGLVLRDSDLYDRACAERAVPKSKCGSTRIKVRADILTENTRLLIELQDDKGSVPISLSFMPDGMVYVRGGGRAEPWRPYSMGRSYELIIDYDCMQNQFAVTFDGSKESFAFSAVVPAVTRVLFATKALMQIPYATLDSVGKYGKKEEVLPFAGEKQPECRLCLLSFETGPGTGY